MESNIGEFGDVVVPGMRVYRLSCYEDSWDGTVTSVNNGMAEVVITGTGHVSMERCFDLVEYDRDQIG